MSDEETRSALDELLDRCICGDTGVLPILVFDEDDNVSFEDEVPCPRCRPQKRSDADTVE